MPGLIELVFAYGLTFGAMNKLPDFVHEKIPRILNRMLACAYCTGFHTGYLAYFAISHNEVVWHHAPRWAFASAAFSYAADTTLRVAEAQIEGKNDES